MKPGYLAAYRQGDRWVTGEIICIYSSGMVVIDAKLADRSRHWIKLSDLHPPF